MEHKDLLRFIDEESHDLESTFEPGGSFLATAGPVELVTRQTEGTRTEARRLRALPMLFLCRQLSLGGLGYFHRCVVVNSHSRLCSCLTQHSPRTRFRYGQYELCATYGL